MHITIHCVFFSQEPNGNSDGSINGFKYFDCPTNHGIFVSFDQIIFTDQKVQGIADSTKRKKGIKNVLGNQVNPALGAVESYGNLELGMRVIAFAENKTGKEQILRGVIRYLGYPPKAQEILAGIELVCK